MPTEPCTDAKEVSRETRLELLRLMLLQRRAEERIMTLYRQGRIVGSVYTGYLQEAVGAGAGLALGTDDVVAPLNREQACHYARGVTVAHVLRNFLGKATGPTFGRDGNMHFGVPERGVFPLVSMLGDLCPVVVGAALAFKRRREPRVALTFFGDGAMSTGERVAAIVATGASVLMSTPTYALRLAEAARQEGVDLVRSALRVSIHAGEPGASIPATRELADALCPSAVGQSPQNARGLVDGGDRAGTLRTLGHTRTEDSTGGAWADRNGRRGRDHEPP